MDAPKPKSPHLGLVFSWILVAILGGWFVYTTFRQEPDRYANLTPSERRFYESVDYHYWEVQRDSAGKPLKDSLGQEIRLLREIPPSAMSRVDTITNEDIASPIAIVVIVRKLNAAIRRMDGE